MLPSAIPLPLPASVGESGHEKKIQSKTNKTRRIKFAAFDDNRFGESCENKQEKYTYIEIRRMVSSS